MTPPPKQPEWWSLMVSDILNEYDSQTPFREIRDKAWRRLCRGRVRDSIGAIDTKTGRVAYMKTHLHIDLPGYRKIT